MEIATDFTLWSSLAGGALIGLGASLLLIGAGRIAGVSGITAEAVFGSGERAWRALFLLGLVGVGLVVTLLDPGAIAASPSSLSVLAVAGFLVGVGTRLGSGCTSGHGVCGISRGSPRSIVATVSFIVTGVVTVAVARWLGALS